MAWGGGRRQRASEVDNKKDQIYGGGVECGREQEGSWGRAGGMEGGRKVEAVKRHTPR